MTVVLRLWRSIIDIVLWSEQGCTCIHGSTTKQKRVEAIARSIEVRIDGMKARVGKALMRYWDDFSHMQHAAKSLRERKKKDW